MTTTDGLLSPAQEALCLLVAMLDTHVPEEHRREGEFLCVGVCPGCGLWQIEYVVHRDWYGSLNIPHYLWVGEVTEEHRFACESFDMLAGLADAPVPAPGRTTVDVLAYLRDDEQP